MKVKIIEAEKPTITLADCKNLKVRARNLLGFKSLDYELPLDNTYMKIFIGRNGCGKSNLLAILGTLIMPSYLKKIVKKDYLKDNSELTLEFELTDGKIAIFSQKGSEIGNWTMSSDQYIFETKYGFFEPPPDSFTGVRRGSYKTQTPYSIEELAKKGEYLKHSSDDKEEQIWELMNWILFGTKEGKFSYLSKIAGSKESITDTYLFLKFENGEVIPFEHFSTGEKFLLGILRHIIRTSRAIRKDIPRPIIIDEIELSLHPFAQSRLIKFLIEFVEKRKNNNLKPNFFSN